MARFSMNSYYMSGIIDVMFAEWANNMHSVCYGIQFESASLSSMPCVYHAAHMYTYACTYVRMRITIFGTLVMGILHIIFGKGLPLGNAHYSSPCFIIIAVWNKSSISPHDLCTHTRRRVFTYCLWFF